MFLFSFLSHIAPLLEIKYLIEGRDSVTLGVDYMEQVRVNSYDSESRKKENSQLCFCIKRH